MIPQTHKERRTATEEPPRNGQGKILIGGGGGGGGGRGGGRGMFKHALFAGNHTLYSDAAHHENMPI